MRPHIKAATFILALGLVALAIHAEDAGGGFGPGRPPLTPVHWWENWGALKDEDQRIDVFDPLKYVPLDDCAKNGFFSLGAEYRERYESWDNFAFGNGPVHDDDGYLLTRFMLYGDLRLQKHIRIFAELKSDWETGRRGPERIYDVDQLDVSSLFVELGCDLDSTGKTIDFRLGRQEMRYGSGRFIEIQDSTNNRQSFDAAKMMLNLGKWQIDAFYSRPVENHTGVFDNHSSKGYSLSGIYAVTHSVPVLKGATLDAYMLRTDVDDALYFKGIHDEHRNTLGVRLSGAFHNFNYDVEQDYQFGEYGNGGIQAWASSNEIGYTFAKTPTTPHPFLRLDAHSGDQGPGHKDLGTFDNPFAAGEYFSEPAPIGPRNMMDIRPAVDWHLRKNLTLTTANIFYWRESLNDGTYFMPGIPMAPPEPHGHRDVGSETIANLQWNFQAHGTFNTSYSHFVGGEFFRHEPSGRNFDYVAAWVTFRF